MPDNYKNAGILMVVAGCINLFLGPIMILASSCLCCTAYITPVIAVGEIACGAMILNGHKVPQAKFVSIAGIAGGVFSLSMMAVAMEAIATILLTNPEIEAYVNGEEYVPPPRPVPAAAPAVPETPADNAPADESDQA